MKIDEALYQLKQNIKMHEIDGTTSNQNEREKALLDYITNLQEERNMFKNSFEIMSKNYFEEKSRNEKAIEYINAGKTFDFIDVGKVVNKIQNDLLNILQGSNKDD